MKNPTFAPAYVGLFPTLSEIARTHGYALAIHGSVSRDFDLIAVPWVDVAAAPEVLVQAIATRLQPNWNMLVDGSGRALNAPEYKPHGRLAWSIPISCGSVIDISVCPLSTSKTYPLS